MNNAHIGNIDNTDDDDNKTEEEEEEDTGEHTQRSIVIEGKRDEILQASSRAGSMIFLNALECSEEYLINAKTVERMCWISAFARFARSDLVMKKNGNEETIEKKMKYYEEKIARLSDEREDFQKMLEDDPVMRERIEKGMTDEDVRESVQDTILRNIAHEVKEFARPPVSNFHVGACCLTNLGRVFVGVNIEIEKCPLNRSVHAEQCLITNAKRGLDYAKNEKIMKIAITHAPCGHCRQFMNELKNVQDITILLPDGIKTTLNDLLPKAFGPLDLDIPGDEEHRHERMKGVGEAFTSSNDSDSSSKHAKLRKTIVNNEGEDGKDAVLAVTVGNNTDIRKLLLDDYFDRRLNWNLERSPKTFEITLQKERTEIGEVVKRLVQALAKSYAPYTRSPTALAVPIYSEGKQGEKQLIWHYSGSVECAAYNPSMSPLHSLQVALHCSPFRPNEDKDNTIGLSILQRVINSKENISKHSLIWNSSSNRHKQVTVFLLGFKNAKISYTKSIKHEILDLLKDGGEQYTVNVHEFLLSNEDAEDCVVIKKLQDAIAKCFKDAGVGEKSSHANSF
jgi:cytidine deaminase